MEPRSLKYVTEACGGELIGGSNSSTVTNVCTDSRQVQPGDLFVALAGERFDAHAFLPEVARRGAVAVIAERNKMAQSIPSCAIIAVESTRQALGTLAARYRLDFTLSMIVVGGSNGKTTTKELLAGVLRQRFKTLWSKASFNNDVGVPLTLLTLEDSHQAAVLEAGTNHPGELAPLVQMIAPQSGVVTSIGREHLEFFGDLRGVAEEEGWLAELLPADGTLFMNGDSPELSSILRRTKAKVVRVGVGAANDWRAAALRWEETGMSFLADTSKSALAGEYRISLLGRHQAVNALFAIAVGAETGLTRDEIQRGLAECQPTNMRMQIHKANNVKVLDDSYNANADSMAAALETLKDYPCPGRRVAVLGDMAELGACSAEAHAEVGHRAAQSDVDQLFAVGKMAGLVGAAARSRGLMRVVELGEVETAASAVKKFVRKGDVVLVKASRAARLERVVEAICGERCDQ